MPDVTQYLQALVPPTAISFVFYRIIRAILEADRRERRALAQWEARQGRPEQPTDGAPPVTREPPPDEHTATSGHG